MKKTVCLLFIVLSVVLSGCMGLNISESDITFSTYDSNIVAGNMNEKYLDALKIVSDEALVSYFENTNAEEFPEDIETLASEEHDFIFVGSPLAWDYVSACADEYPEKIFAITDIYDKKIPDNITNIKYKYYEGAYLAGYIAGKTIEEKKLGILCEQEDVPTSEMIYAFAAGAIEAGGNIEFEINYIGTDYTNNTAYDAATSLYNNGCEIVFQNLVNPDGAINAADVAEKFIIGVGVDQSVKSASNVLTTVVVNYDIALSKVLNEFIADNESVKGKTYEYGLSDYVVSLSKTTTHIDKAVFSQVSKIKESILTGGFDVPKTFEAVEKLKEEAIKNPPAEEPEETDESTDETQTNEKNEQ